MKEKKNGLPVIQPDAAGIDISSKEHFVAVNPEKSDVLFVALVLSQNTFTLLQPG